MKSIFYNSDEQRIRAFWRISLVTASIFTLFTFWIFLTDDFIWMMCGLAIITFLVISLACPALDKRPFREMGFAISKNWVKDLVAGLFIAAFTMSLMTLLMWQFGYLQINISPDAGMNSDFIRSITGLLILMIAVSVWEEIYFRGYLLRNLQDGFTPKTSQLTYPLVAAVLGSSLIFGFVHTSNPNSSILSFINITFAGIVLAYPYIYTKSMAISVGLHISWNYFQGVIYGMPVSGLVLQSSFFHSIIAEPQILTGGQFGPEGGAIGLSGLFVMALLCSIYLHKFREVT